MAADPFYWKGGQTAETKLSMCVVLHTLNKHEHLGGYS